MPKVSDAQAAFDAGSIDAAAYITLLGAALDELDAFDNQLSAKIQNGQLTEPAASEVRDASSRIRALIELLISNAAP